MSKLSKLATCFGLLIGSHVVSLPLSASNVPAQRPVRPSEAAVSAWLENNRHRPPSLRAFVQRMPKGGDIHSHLSGAVYAEHYLKWAAADGYCVDPKGPALVKPSACGQNPSYFAASDLLQRPNTYAALVNLWSTRNLPFAGRSGHDQFFDAFSGFDLISSSLTRQDDMVAEVANRAASQHINYLELMLTIQGSPVRTLGRTVGWTGNFAQMRQQLLALGLNNLVAQGSQDLATLNAEVAKTLGCETPMPQPGCEVKVRYLQQTTRTRPLKRFLPSLSMLLSWLKPLPASLASI